MNDWYDAEQRVEKAQELFAQRKWREALAELRAAIEINPYNSAWYYNSGIVLDELGQWDVAIGSYREAVELEPDDVEAWYRLGVDLLRTGRRGDAEGAFQKVELIDAAFEPAYCQRIILYAEMGEHEKAEEMFYLARQYKEDCPHCYYNMGCSLLMRRQYDRAIYCWQKTLDLDDAYPRVHARIAEAYRGKGDQGDRDKARQHLLQELRADPGSTRAMLDLGELLMEMGRADEAGEKFRRAMETSPESAASHFGYGCWMLAAGRFDEAAELFEGSLSLDPTFAGAHLHLGVIALRRGDVFGARQQLRAELLLRPQDPGLLMQLSNLLIDCGEHRPAVACLRRLVQLEPDNAAAWQNLGVALFLRREYEEGITACHQSLRCEPRQVQAMHNLALAHYRVGDADAAKQWVSRGLHIEPHDTGLLRLELRIRLSRWWRAIRRMVGR